MTRTYRVIRVDIDQEYEKFKRYIEPVYMGYIEWARERLGLCIESVNVKPSTNGNTHIRINLCGEPASRLEYIYLLMLFQCDLNLVSLSYLRLQSFDDPVVRMYERKRRRKREHSEPKP